MLKDAPLLNATEIAMAIVWDEQADGSEWVAHFINLKNEVLENVMITSRGYGERDGEKIYTSTLRFFVEKMEPKSYYRIELLTEELVPLSNEFWVSFFYNNQLQERKFVFLPHTIQSDNMVKVPIVEKKGVLIQ
jgi:hypothetical protein